MREEQLDSRLTSGRNFLQNQVIRWVQVRGPSRKGLVNALTKAIPGCERRPSWMNEPEFDGQSWSALNIAERKYILRHAVDELLADGRLYYKVYQKALGPKHRLVVRSLLDVLSTIDPDDG
jgi:hypothetical protein